MCTVLFFFWWCCGGSGTSIEGEERKDILAGMTAGRIAVPEQLEDEKKRKEPSLPDG